MTENALQFPDPGEFIFYQTEDGQTRVQVRMDRDTVWVSQKATEKSHDQTGCPMVGRNLPGRYQITEVNFEKFTYHRSGAMLGSNRMFHTTVQENLS